MNVTPRLSASSAKLGIVVWTRLDDLRFGSEPSGSSRSARLPAVPSMRRLGAREPRCAALASDSTRWVAAHRERPPGSGVESTADLLGAARARSHARGRQFGLADRANDNVRSRHRARLCVDAVRRPARCSPSLAASAASRSIAVVSPGSSEMSDSRIRSLGSAVAAASGQPGPKFEHGGPWKAEAGKCLPRG